MRIAFCYPPFTKEGRLPNLPQNRQFIYTASRAVKLYPVVMATAATWLKSLGHDVLWLDGITRRLSFSEYNKELSSFSPDVIILESKAPIMRNLWRYVDNFKFKNPKVKVILVGDHTTYFPEESLKNSKADFVLTGGDYDFLLVSLVRHLERGTKMEAGIWWRENSKCKNQKSKLQFKIQNSGKFRLDHNLDETPIIDRELTRWRDYGEAYLVHPCAYVMFGRGCGIKYGSNGACTFCIWQHSLWSCSARLRSPKHVVTEVKNLVSLGVKEIFDDTESCALGDYLWLEEFYRLLKKEKLFGKVIFSSNARGDQLDEKTCHLLKKTGYRLVKVGLESGANVTLAKIGKKEKVEDIISGVKNAKDAGLRVMLTVMVGYPWENEKDVQKTYDVTRNLMFYNTRAGDCLQASVITPYPGTPLFGQAVKNDWLKVRPDEYEKFDMSNPILKAKIDAQKWCNKIWSIQRDPQFILRSGLGIRSKEEALVLLRGANSLLGHIRDYATHK